MRPTFKIRNWANFQHYKKRNPPWIKLHTDTFQNYDFACLQDASKLLAICYWTLAARSKTGEVPADFEYVKRQCNLSDFVTIDNLKELVSCGFIEDASNVLATCKQNATTEGEAKAYNREDDNKNITNKLVIQKVQKKSRDVRKGTRLPEDFQIPDDWGDWAVGMGFTVDQVNIEFTKFYNYWTAKSGASATKLDWRKTWQNWVLNNVQYQR